MRGRWWSTAELPALQPSGFLQAIQAFLVLSAGNDDSDGNERHQYHQNEQSFLNALTHNRSLLAWRTALPRLRKWYTRLSWWIRLDYCRSGTSPTWLGLLRRTCRCCRYRTSWLSPSVFFVAALQVYNATNVEHGLCLTANPLIFRECPLPLDDFRACIDYYCNHYLFHLLSPWGVSWVGGKVARIWREATLLRCPSLNSRFRFYCYSYSHLAWCVDIFNKVVQKVSTQCQHILNSSMRIPIPPHSPLYSRIVKNFVTLLRECPQITLCCLWEPHHHDGLFLIFL